MSTNIRIGLGILLLASVIFAPPWVAAVFSCILVLRWRAWEVIGAGMLMDLLWMPVSVSFLSFDAFPLSTIIACIAVFGLEPLRRQFLLGPALH